jgi:hypothetical protein
MAEACGSRNHRETSNSPCLGGVAAHTPRPIGTETVRQSSRLLFPRNAQLHRFGVAYLNFAGSFERQVGPERGPKTTRLRPGNPISLGIEILRCWITTGVPYQIKQRF